MESVWLFIFHVLLSYVDNEIYKQNLQFLHPFVTGLAAFMGLYAFGLQGIIIGPLLVTIIKFTYQNATNSTDFL